MHASAIAFKHEIDCCRWLLSSNSSSVFTHNLTLIATILICKYSIPSNNIFIIYSCKSLFKSIFINMVGGIERMKNFSYFHSNIIANLI